MGDGVVVARNGSGLFWVAGIVGGRLQHIPGDKLNSCTTVVGFAGTFLTHRIFSKTLLFTGYALN